MFSLKNYQVIVLGVLSLFLVAGCTNTNLDEKVSDQLTENNFLLNEKERDSAVGAAYSNFSAWGNHFNIWSLNELSSDEIVIPTRGGDWYDGGVLLQLHQHTYEPNNPMINSAWGVAYGGINTVNRLLSQFNDVKNAETTIAELKAIRAFWYYHLLDMFGNVPLSIDFEDTELKANSARKDVYDFVLSEINAAMAEAGFAKTKGNGVTTKMGYCQALTLRHKLYLNAEVYTGTAAWQKAIDDADEIIKDCNFELEDTYSDNFSVQNQSSTENIFTVPYDKVFFQGFNWNQMTLHYASQETFNFQEQPWNGYATVEAFYNSYVDPSINPGPTGKVFKGVATQAEDGTLDKRLSNFLVGPQGVEDPSGGGDGDADGLALNFTPKINAIYPNACRQCGARIQKYAFEKGGTSNMSNDFVLFRLADVMLGKAEAHHRLGDSAGALGIVNQIRERAGVDKFDSLDEAKLLAERGREMFVENVRRQDLVRFGKYNDPWWEKERSASHMTVFPIPQDQLDANPNLTQNPGY